MFTLDRGEESVAVLVAVKPTPSPTFDPRPTLEMVKERRYIRCGLKAEMVKTGGFYLDLASPSVFPLLIASICVSQDLTSLPSLCFRQPCVSAGLLLL